MKFLVVLNLSFAVLAVDTRPSGRTDPNFVKDTLEQATNCADELGPDAKDLGSITNGIVEEDNDSFNYYFGCIWKKKGIIKDNGEIDKEKLVRYFEGLFTMGDDVTPAVTLTAYSVANRCKDLQGKDDGQTAVKINNCALSHLQNKK